MPTSAFAEIMWKKIQMEILTEVSGGLVSVLFWVLFPFFFLQYWFRCSQMCISVQKKNSAAKQIFFPDSNFKKQKQTKNPNHRKKPNQKTKPKPNKSLHQTKNNKSPNRKPKNSPKIQPKPAAEYNMKMKDRILYEKSNIWTNILNE